MDQLKRMLASLSAGQKITMFAVLLLLGGGLYTLARWRTETDFKPLVTGLAVEDSAAVVQKLKEAGADYRLNDTGTVISVPSAKLAELRLELAGARLPKTGRIGFEIFDKSDLGATDFVEHINYRRALEGELERSLGAMAGVEQARPRQLPQGLRVSRRTRARQGQRDGEAPPGRPAFRAQRAGHRPPGRQRG
jgi:flagellar M-ring protein FliF